MRPDSLTMSMATTTRPSPPAWRASQSYFPSTTPLGPPCKTPPSAGQPVLGKSASSPRHYDSIGASYFNLIPASDESGSGVPTPLASLHNPPRQSGYATFNHHLVPPQSWGGEDMGHINRHGLIHHEGGRATPRIPTPYTDPTSIASPPDSKLYFASINRTSMPPPSFPVPATMKPRAVQRAETSPSFVDHGVKMVSAKEVMKMLARSSSSILVLDVRPSPQYLSGKIKGSLNLCIPTTLLKRPSFNLQKVENTLGSEQQKRKLRQWMTSTHIIAYDSSTANLSEASTLISVLKKFTGDGWAGEPLVLRGGFDAFSEQYPHLIEADSSRESRGRQASLSVGLTLPACDPATISRPSASGNLCRSIRQNLDLIDGVGQISVKMPPHMTRHAKRSLPQWLQETCNREDNGKLISEKFLSIEMAEQRRMQEALTDSSAYAAAPSSGPSPAKKVCRIAGLEQGLKNRYSNIYPFDHSRVKLEDISQGSCDYVNASHVKASRSNKRYIATQAPLPATFNDFWRVVWEQDVRVIVMLTAESEGAQLKCHRYWGSGNYGPFRLKLMAEHAVPLPSRKSRAPGSAAEVPRMIVRHLTLCHASLPFAPLREITQLQYSHWPDFGGAEPSHLVHIVEECDRISQGGHTLRTSPEPVGQRKVLVHCSAGCGRTGTFCTVDSVIDMLKRQRLARQRQSFPRARGSSDDWVFSDDVDLIAATVEDFRGQRLSMVQSLRQFVLCYESVLEWLSSHDDENEMR